MRLFTAAAALVLVLGWSQGPAWVKGPTVNLTSLEWPPFTGEHLKDQGTNTVVVKAAFKAMGYSAEVEFVPWSRAVALARESDEFIGYFPEYLADSVAEQFIYSDPIGRSPIGFVERADAPVVWTTLKDLQGLTIGTVQDYVNTDEFDRMAATGELKVETAIDDVSNVRKVLAGRIPLAVIDRNVLEYLLATVPDLTEHRNALQFNTRQLEDKYLFACFRKGPEGEKMVKIFNEGLRKLGTGPGVPGVTAGSVKP
jgi:polar amino acid transport system substrate-binding protein